MVDGPSNEPGYLDAILATKWWRLVTNVAILGPGGGGPHFRLFSQLSKSSCIKSKVPGVVYAPEVFNVINCFHFGCHPPDKFCQGLRAKFSTINPRALSSVMCEHVCENQARKPFQEIVLLTRHCTFRASSSMLFFRRINYLRSTQERFVPRRLVVIRTAFRRKISSKCLNLRQSA